MDTEEGGKCHWRLTHTALKRLGQASKKPKEQYTTLPKLYFIQLLLITDLIPSIPFYNPCLLELSGPGNNFIGA